MHYYEKNQTIGDLFEKLEQDIRDAKGLAKFALATLKTAQETANEAEVHLELLKGIVFEDVMTLAQVAQMVNRSESTVSDAVKRGRLTATKVRGKYWVRRPDAEAYADWCRKKDKKAADRWAKRPVN